MPRHNPSREPQPIMSPPAIQRVATTAEIAGDRIARRDHLLAHWSTLVIIFVTYLAG